MDKFEEIKKQETDGINCNITNEMIIQKLQAWDAAYGVDISDVGHNQLAVRLHNLPDNLEAFAGEVYEFCPDIVDQGFGCMDEMVEMYEETGQPVPEETKALIEGIDFEDDSFGIKLLARAIEKEKFIKLWWD